MSNIKDGFPDWETECEICGTLPTVSPTGLCGVCCFGEADAINWWEDKGLKNDK